VKVIVVKRTLATVAAIGVVTGCSSTNPCQTPLTPLDYGDCADLADSGIGDGGAGYGFPSRSSCQDSCTSFSDQAEITAIFACWNTIPADAGACSMANETAWSAYVGGQVIRCLSGSGQLSTPCLGALFPDAG
jgi:hypothetical protein